MTISTTGNQLWKTQEVILAVIAGEVGFNGNTVNAVLLHQLMISMALLAYVSMECAYVVIVRITKLFNFVKIVAVEAGSRIHVASLKRLTMY